MIPSLIPSPDRTICTVPVCGRRSRFRVTSAAAVGVAALLAFATGSQAASATYTGTAADNNFDNGANWSTGTPPGDTTAGVTTNQDVAMFAQTPTTGAALTLAAQRNLLGLTFQGSATATTPAYTIGTTAGPAFLLSSGGTILAAASASSQIVNAPLILQNAAAAGSGTYTFQSDVPGTSRLLTIGGAVTGAATTGNTTTLTLTGVATTLNPVTGVVSDGSGGGTLAVVKSGTGSWTINGGTNTYTGGTTIAGGTLRTTSGTTSAAFGSGAITMAGTGGTLAFGASTTTANNPFVINGTTNFLNSKGGTFAPTSLTGTGTLSIVSGVAVGSTATVSFTDLKNFAGTLDIGAGVAFRALTGAVAGSAANLNLILETGGAFTENIGTNNAVNNVTIGSLAGGGTIGASLAGTGIFTYVVGGNNASTTFSGLVVDGGTKSALNKAGTGTMNLTGASTFSGGTTVTGGTLRVNNTTGSGTGSGVVLVNGGILGGGNGTSNNATLPGTFTGGATSQTFAAGLLGLISGAVTVNSGGTLAPGNSVGTITLGSDLTLASGSLLSYEFNATANDFASVAGVLTLNGGSFSLLQEGTANPLTTLGVYNLLSYGTLAGSIANLSVGNPQPGLGYNFVNDTADKLIQLQIVTAAVPEPSTWALLGAGLGVLAMATARRQRRQA